MSSNLLRNFFINSIKFKNFLNVDIFLRRNSTANTPQEVNFDFNKPEINIEIPKLESEFAKQVKSITSIDISSELIAWIQIDNNGLVLDWNYHKLEHINNIKNSEFEIAYDYLDKIFKERLSKDSSVFLFETRAYKIKQTKLVPYLVRVNRNETIFQSIIKAFINQSESQSQKKIFTVNSIRLAKKLKLLIGGERIHSSDLVKTLLNHGFSQEANTLKDIYLRRYVLKMPQHFYDLYSKNKEIDGSIREPLAKSYLQASCFLRILNDTLNKKEN